MTLAYSGGFSSISSRDSSALRSTHSTALPLKGSAAACCRRCCSSSSADCTGSGSGKTQRAWRVDTAWLGRVETGIADGRTAGKAAYAVQASTLHPAAKTSRECGSMHLKRHVVSMLCHSPPAHQLPPVPQQISRGMLHRHRLRRRRGGTCCRQGLYHHRPLLKGPHRNVYIRCAICRVHRSRQRGEKAAFAHAPANLHCLLAGRLTRAAN